MKIIGIGETVYDIIFRDNQPQRAVAGGSTYNAMISLGRTIGKDLLFISETGDDRIGRMIISFLRNNNISTDYMTVNKGTKSHISLAFLDENNDAEYTFYKDHENASIPDTFPKVSRDDLVLFGSFFAINPVIRPLTSKFLHMAHDAGAMLYYDVNFRRPHLKDLPVIMPNIEENYRMASIVRGSSDDFQIMYGTSDMAEIYKKHIEPFCKTLIITDGAKPVKVFTSPDEDPLMFDVHTSNDAIVSTIGAGDNFNAGFLYGLYKQGKDKNYISASDWEQLIATAQRFSQAVCHSIENYVSTDFINTL